MAVATDYPIGGQGTDTLLGNQGTDFFYGGADIDYFTLLYDVVAGDADYLLDFTAGVDFVLLPYHRLGQRHLRRLGQAMPMASSRLPASTSYLYPRTQA